MNKFSGEIEAQSVVDLIQIHITQGVPVKIKIKGTLFEAYLWIDKGTVVHAELNDLSGVDAFYQAIMMDQGLFSVEANVEAPVQSMHKPFTELVLESYVLIDEGKIKKQEPKINKKSDSFKTWQSKLEEFANIDGFCCSLLIDTTNGMCVFDKFVNKDFHLKSEQISAFLTEDYKNKRKLENAIDAKLIETINVFEKYYFLYRLISKKYLLAVVLLSENTNLAMARIMLEENSN
jgi:hypothetical protein